MKNLSPQSIIPPEGITHFTPPLSTIYANDINSKMGLNARRPRATTTLVYSIWLLLLLCLHLLSPFESSGQIETEDPEVNTVCMQIRIFDVSPNPSNPGIQWYASSPLSTEPNTINICRPTDFEITDDPSVSDGRCFVPVAEGGFPQMYVLYLMSNNQAATLPPNGTVVPQASGSWSTLLNAANIPTYNQNTFPPPASAGVFTPFSINTAGQYAVIAAICTLNSNNQYEIISSTSGSPVSDKVYINFLDSNQPVTISGEQFLCEGASNIYSIPASLAGFNPQWSVVGGTIVGSGTNIQVNWSNPYTANSRVSVTLQLAEGGCELSGTLNTYACCIPDIPSKYSIYNKSLSQTVFNGMSVVSPFNTPYTTIVINGVFHIDANIHFQDMSIVLGPQAKITLANNVELTISETSNLSAFLPPPGMRAGCAYMYDGIYVTNHTQKVTINNFDVRDAINGIVSINGGQINVLNSRFNNYRNAIQIINYNPTQVPTYSASTSPLTLYGNQFRGGQNIVPYLGQYSETSVKVINSGYVEIGKRNQGSNRFNPQLGNPLDKMGLAISMINSGGNIVNNRFEGINVIGSPSQAGAIMASTTSHQSWIAPLQIGKLWTGGAAGDANHFENGYLAIQTTNVRSVFVQENTFKDNSSNIVLINASNQRVVQFNKINYQLGSTATPNRSALGISIASTQGVPTSGGIVSDNHVEACAQGIMLTTVNSMTVTYNDIRTFTTQGGSQSSIRSGISAVNGWNINIYRNNMQHNNLPLNSDVSGNNLRGINLNNVVDAFVWDNYVLRYGAGIYAANDNRVSQFRCNFLVNSIWGFNFANVYLDQQGNPGDPTDNQWVGNRRAIRTNGNNDFDMASRDWFYRGGFEFNPNTLAPTLITINPILTSAGEIECSNVVLPNDTNPNDDKYEDPEIVEEVFGAVVDSSIQFSSASLQYFEESMTYRILDQNTAIIQQTSTHQQAFDDFYTTHNTSSKGDVKRLYDALLGKTTDDYEQLLSTFQPNNTFESKIAEVSAVYAQSWAKGRFELDSAERNVLLPIAQADAIAWGEAVYTARVMLGMFDLDGNIANGNQRRALNEVVLPEQELSKPYPNPTTGAFALVGSIETGLEKANIRLLDLQGRVVANAVVLYNDGAWQVADLNLPAGMYMYEFSINAELMQRGKIIIK